tara:strand:+ start:868 stop:1398 length:531 start_codon:yes stop_codon:yes gene_type:complete
MSFYTANHTVPDLNYEYNIVTVDSIGQSSANDFQVHLQTPLNSVVQAKLMGAHIHTTVQTDHIYISIDELELDPILNQRASNVAGGQPLLSNVTGTFATLISRAIVPAAGGHSDDTYVYTFENQYPIVSQYLSPLQNLSTLTVKIYDQNGDLLPPNDDDDPNHLILSFITRRRIVP